MPKVEFYHPPEPVQWLVRQFEIIKDNGTCVLADQFIPRPDVALVFHFKTLPEIIDPIQIALKPVFLAPIALKTKKLFVHGDLDTFIVTCKASVLSRILCLDLRPGPNIIQDMPSRPFTGLWQDLASRHTHAERIECFCDFIKTLVPAGYVQDYIDICYERIIENSIGISIPKLAHDSFHSLTSLQRNFKKRVGVNLKKLVRIARVSHIFDCMLKERAFNCQNLLFEGDYYDQAHFIKEFKAFTGQTPKQFFLNHSELCQILSGKPAPLTIKTNDGLTE